MTQCLELLTINITRSVHEPILAGGYLMFTDATSAILFPWIKGNLTNKYISQLHDLRNHFSVKQFYNINL